MTNAFLDIAQRSPLTVGRMEKRASDRDNIGECFVCEGPSRAWDFAECPSGKAFGYVDVTLGYDAETAETITYPICKRCFPDALRQVRRKIVTAFSNS